jgi:predicted GNAT family acetyltransferase
MALADDYSRIPLQNNTDNSQKRFELRLEEGVAYTEYMINKLGVIYLTHTEVPQALEGKGVGSALIQKVLHYIREDELKMAPLCPFVAVYIKRHPEAAKDLLAPGFHIGQ